MNDNGDSPIRRRAMLLAGLTAWALPARAGSPHEPALALTPPFADYAADALARLIEIARQRAIADGVRPVSSTVSRALVGYFPPALLQRVRFADTGADSLALPALAFSYGDAKALALGEVVLFKTERLARSDLGLWAHELTHVMQYQRWGIDGFAARYVRDSVAVEQEAIDNATRFTAWLQRHGG